MACLIIGLDYLTKLRIEVFIYSIAQPISFVKPDEDAYMYLLVNIGLGVSFILMGSGII
ncbi:hypothetical protein V8C35DRAFT_298419 [Trichoderma chlorosporum]